MSGCRFFSFLLCGRSGGLLDRPFWSLSKLLKRMYWAVKVGTSLGRASGRLCFLSRVPPPSLSVYSMCLLYFPPSLSVSFRWHFPCSAVTSDCVFSIPDPQDGGVLPGSGMCESALAKHLDGEAHRLELEYSSQPDKSSSLEEIECMKVRNAVSPPHGVLPSE